MLLSNLHAARVDAVNDHGVSALAIACRNGSGSMVDLLLDRGANVTAAEPSGETALMAGGHTDVVRVLLASGANVHARSTGVFTPLLFAASVDAIAGSDYRLVVEASGHEALGAFFARAWCGSEPGRSEPATDRRVALSSRRLCRAWRLQRSDPVLAGRAAG